MFLIFWHGIMKKMKINKMNTDCPGLPKKSNEKDCNVFEKKQNKSKADWFSKSQTLLKRNFPNESDD